MEEMSDDVLLQELSRRFLDTKKALHDLKVMNEKIEKLNAKLAESERLKSNFLSNIRNEINNPLTSILELARKLAEPGRDEQAKNEMARAIHEEAFELNFQLRNIFLAAELEAGEATPQRAHVDVRALIQRVVRSFSHQTEKKSLSVDLAFSADTLVFVTDPEKLHLVIANLCANAIEFNREQKTIRIDAGIENGSLCISVADEGTGIPEQERDRLFERFRQMDQGSSKSHKGHGLGLSITKAVIDMLGGKVTVGRAPNGGALFRLVLPPSAPSVHDVFSEEGNEFLFDEGSRF